MEVFLGVLWVWWCLSHGVWHVIIDLGTVARSGSESGAGGRQAAIREEQKSRMAA